MNSAFLKLDKVVKRYGARRVVEGVSLDVAEGEIVALLGPSGCGKTTTLRLIAGLERVDEGEIWIGGERVAAPGRNLLPPHRRGIGFVFQDLALWPHLTVEGSLEFVLSSAGVSKPERRIRIAETLASVRASSFASRHPGELSGGEQQRAAIARALVAGPRLLLLDEPMSGLDAHLKSELMEELAALQTRLKITTILVTHDRTEATGLAHRIALMRDGSIEQIRTVSSTAEHKEGSTIDNSRKPLLF